MGMTFEVDNLEDMCAMVCDNIIPQHKEYDRCLRCGRKLKKSEYRLRGYGKICWEKIIVKNSKKLFTFF